MGTILLTAYLASVGITFGTCILTDMAHNNRLKREGYAYKKENLSISEKVINFIQDLPTYIFACGIPLVNLIGACWLIKEDKKLYEETKKENIDDGTIYKVETTKPIIKEQIKGLIKEYNITPEEVLEIADIKEEKETKEEHVPNMYPRIKKYSEMTRGEIIEALGRLKKELEEAEAKEKEQGQTLKLGL